MIIDASYLLQSLCAAVRQEKIGIDQPFPLTALYPLPSISMAQAVSVLTPILVLSGSNRAQNGSDIALSADTGARSETACSGYTDRGRTALTGSGDDRGLPALNRPGVLNQPTGDSTPKHSAYANTAPMRMQCVYQYSIS